MKDRTQELSHAEQVLAGRSSEFAALQTQAKELEELREMKEVQKPDRHLNRYLDFDRWYCVVLEDVSSCLTIFYSTHWYVKPYMTILQGELDKDLDCCVDVTNAGHCQKESANSRYSEEASRSDHRAAGFI